MNKTLVTMLCVVTHGRPLCGPAAVQPVALPPTRKRRHTPFPRKAWERGSFFLGSAGQRRAAYGRRLLAGVDRLVPRHVELDAVPRKQALDPIEYRFGHPYFYSATLPVAAHSTARAIIRSMFGSLMIFWS